jgi:hypothetical protein
MPRLTTGAFEFMGIKKQQGCAKKRFPVVSNQSVLTAWFII